MAKAVKLDQSTLKYYQMLGIYPLQSNQTYSFNSTSIAVAFAMIGMFITAAAFFLFEAETIEESLKTFYVALTQLIFLICFVENIWKMETILKIIQKNEEFIEKSELAFICNEISSKEGKII